MGIATYKDLCIDVNDREKAGPFWAAALGLGYDDDDPQDALLKGDGPEKSVWINVVPEAKTVKQRVHIDVHTGSIDDLLALGATMLEPADEYGRHWSVMADPEGGEFCAFVRDPDKLPDYRLHELVIDCADPHRLAQWWADVFGASLEGREDNNWWWLSDIPGLPYDSWDFVPVPEPKTVKNRIHWDVSVESVDPLIAAGATVLRRPDDEISWTVMADPEGNEFCVFTPPAKG
jgi:catechol 2,3-dioxygenase-like lactoylglutathione lyase family enzyme